MSSIAWAKQKNIEGSDWIVYGVPDESGSHSNRKGSSKGPDAIRKISNERGVFSRKGKKIIVEPQKGELKDNVFDSGNIKKKDVRGYIRETVFDGRKPIVLGGDHSITFEILKGFNDVKKDISVIYLDSHPDFVCSSHKYYGSVLCDVLSLKNVDLRSSVEVGVRAPEKEELVNIKKKHLITITPLDIVERGIVDVVRQIKRIVGKNVQFIWNKDLWKIIS